MYIYIIEYIIYLYTHIFKNHFQYPTVKRLPSPLEPQGPGVHQRLLPQRKSCSVPSRKMWKRCEQMWKCEFLINLYCASFDQEMLKECGQQLFCSLAVAANNLTSDFWLSLTSYFCKSKKANVFHHMKDPKIRTPKEATEATEAPCGNPRPGASHCDPTWSTKPIAHRSLADFADFAVRILQLTHINHSSSKHKAQGRHKEGTRKAGIWHRQIWQEHRHGVAFAICTVCFGMSQYWKVSEMRDIWNMFQTCSKHVPYMFQTCSKHVKDSLQGQLWVWRCQSVAFFAFCLACKICNSNIYLCTAHLSRWRHVRTSIQRCSRWFPNGIKWFTCGFLCKISWSKNHYEGGLKTQCSKCSKILGWTELKPVSWLSCQGQGHHPMGMATLGSSDGPIYFLRRTHFEGCTTYAFPSPRTHLFPLQHESGGPANRTCWALVSVQRFQSDTCHLLQFILMIINDH